MRYLKTALILLCALLLMLIVIGCDSDTAVTTAPEKPPIAPGTVAGAVTTAAVTTNASVTTAADTAPVETVTANRVDDTPVTVFYPWN